jgi:hypothetical protein
MTKLKVIGFCVNYVASLGNQAKGLSSLVTRLKGFARGEGTAWISEADELEVRRACRTLENLFPFVVRPALPITFEVIGPALEYLRGRPQHGLFELQLCAILLLAHSGLLRGSEFCDGHLLRRDVTFVAAGPLAGRGGMNVALWYRKMKKRSWDPREDGTMVVRKQGAALCAVSAVEAYIDAARPGLEEPLFQERCHRTGHVVNPQGFGYDALTRAIRALFTAVRIPNAEKYTARGFRAGGHTDAYAETEDFHLVGLLGGWKSEEAQRRYARLQQLGFKHLSEVFS